MFYAGQVLYTSYTQTYPQGILMYFTGGYEMQMRHQLQYRSRMLDQL